MSEVWNKLDSGLAEIYCGVTPAEADRSCG